MTQCGIMKNYANKTEYDFCVYSVDSSTDERVVTSMDEKYKEKYS